MEGQVDTLETRKTLITTPNHPHTDLLAGVSRTTDMIRDHSLRSPATSSQSNRQHGMQPNGVDGQNLHDPKYTTIS